MLVYAPGWSLASHFWSYTPPQKLVFPRPKKWKFPIENEMRTPAFENNLRSKFFVLLFWLFLSKILSRRLSRTTSNPAQKSGKIQAKIAFLMVAGENFGTILSRRSRLSRTSLAPSRLSRPRPIYCDARPKRTVKIFPVFGQFIFRTKKVFSKGPASSDDLHPKRSP